MISRRHALVSAGIATAAVLGIGGLPAASAAPAPLIIAVEAPLTGSQAANGKDMLRGVILAAREVNARGGVLGHPVKIVRIDDKADPALAKSSVAKAKRAGAFAVVGPYNSSVGVINLPLYLKNSIVPVHMTSTNDTDGEGVTVQPKNNQISPVESTYVLSTGTASVAMLVDPSTYTQGMADRLASSLTSQGVSVTQIPIAEGQADYTSEVAQALATSPGLLYSSTYYPEGSKIAIAIEAATTASSTKCLMGLANVDPTFVTEAGLAASQRCVFSGVPTAAQMPGKRAAAYVRAYERAFDKEPGVWGIFTYDSARLLFASIERAGRTTFDSALAKLKHTRNYAGATGTITIDPDTGNRRVVPVYILDVDDAGEFVVIQ